jgi:hypothetical protein
VIKYEGADQAGMGPRRNQTEKKSRSQWRNIIKSLSNLRERHGKTCVVIC